MKQVVFAIALLAMASLTGCLNTEDSPVDENIDTTDDSTSDTTEDNTDTTEDNTDTTQDDTKDDELIEPVGTDGGYTPPATANITVFTSMDDEGANNWIAKDGNRITTSCYRTNDTLEIYDSEMNLIYSVNGIMIHNVGYDYGTSPCTNYFGYPGYRVDVTLGPEPAKAGLMSTSLDDAWDWFLSF